MPRVAPSRRACSTRTAAPTWANLDWTAAMPAGTGVALSYRTGNTARSRWLLDVVRDRHRPGRRSVRDVALHPVPRRPVEHRPEPDTDAVAGLDRLSGRDTRYHGALGRQPESIFGCDRCCRSGRMSPSASMSRSTRRRSRHRRCVSAPRAQVPMCRPRSPMTIRRRPPRSIRRPTLHPTPCTRSRSPRRSPITPATSSAPPSRGRSARPPRRRRSPIRPRPTSAPESRHRTPMSPPSAMGKSSSIRPSAPSFQGRVCPPAGAPSRHRGLQAERPRSAAVC